MSSLSLAPFSFLTSLRRKPQLCDFVIWLNKQINSNLSNPKFLFPSLHPTYSRILTVARDKNLSCTSSSWLTLLPLYGVMKADTPAHPTTTRMSLSLPLLGVFYTSLFFQDISPSMHLLSF